MSSLYGLLVQTSDANLTNGMRQLNEIYTRYYNRRHGLTSIYFSREINQYWLIRMTIP
jgi:putative transposase